MAQPKRHRLEVEDPSTPGMDLFTALTQACNYRKVRPRCDTGGQKRTVLIKTGRRTEDPSCA